MMMGGGCFGAGMWLFGLLTVVGVALLAVVLTRMAGGGPATGGGSGSRASRAREILDERYARGDITTEDYQERLQALDQR